MLLVSLALNSWLGAWASPVGDWAGKVVRWNITSASPALFTYVNSVDAKVTGAAATAFAKWQGIGSSYIAFQGGTPANAQITIEVSTLANGFASAQAIPTIDASGNITGCTVQVSSTYVSAAANSTALEPTLTHEVGHCLGLAHSVSYGAVMSYRSGGSDPTDDDVYAVTLLYPNDDQLNYPLGCATVATPRRGSGGPSAGPLESLVILGTLALIWLRLRSRESLAPVRDRMHPCVRQ